MNWRRAVTLILVGADLQVGPAAWAATADHIVISEFASQAPDRNRDGKLEDKDQFIELYNPTSRPLDITNWRVYHLVAGSTAWGSFEPNPSERDPQTKMIVEINAFARKAALLKTTTSTLASWTTGYVVEVDSTDVDGRWAGSKVQVPAGAHFLLAHGTTTKGLVNYYATLDPSDPRLRKPVLNPGNVEADLYWFDSWVDVSTDVVSGRVIGTPPDFPFSPSVSPLGSSLVLVRPALPGETAFLTHGASSYVRVDMIGWGGATSAGYETSPAPLQTTQDIKSLQTFESVSRRAESEDTNNNTLDFAIRATRDPQNLKSALIKPGAVEADLLVSPQVFSPERTGREQTSITWKAPTDNTVTLKVFDRMGRLAIPLLEREPGGARTVRWDGRDTLGAIVPIGYYIVSLEVFDPQNQRVEHREAVVVIATPLKD